MVRRTLPEDPGVLVVNWTYRDNSVVVWEDANEIFPWCLRWEVYDPGPDGGSNGDLRWSHQETFPYASDALIRAGVITHAVEFDDRLVQPNLEVGSDRAAFDALVGKLLGFTTARRESTALPHHVRR